MDNYSLLRIIRVLRNGRQVYVDNKTDLIKCPSCGHENAPYVDRCILCDFSIALYLQQPQSRSMQRQNDDKGSFGNSKKALGPLPDSDLLIDKQKSKRGTSRILYCDECNTANRAGTLMCSNCGARLPQDGQDSSEDISKARDTERNIPSFFDPMRETNEEIPILEHEPDTQSVSQADLDINHPREIPTVISHHTLDNDIVEIPPGCVKFTPWMLLHLKIDGFSTPISVRPLEDKPLLIGHRHESLPIQPHIDLTPYLEGKHGVSRRHALLRLRGNRLELHDLNSTNGTSINGVRFSPKESHQLRHQDVIQLGQVQIKITFTQRARSSQAGNTDQLYS